MRSRLRSAGGVLTLGFVVSVVAAMFLGEVVAGWMMIAFCAVALGSLFGGSE